MTAKGNKQRSLELADRPGPLKRQDLLCPICWSLLFEPVRLPCSHNLCLVCYTKHIQETSLQCPCCRMRLSVWSRKAAREKNLVDQKLWTRIQKEFPKLVQTRILGEDSQFLNETDLISVLEDRKNVSQPPPKESSLPPPPPPPKLESLPPPPPPKEKPTAAPKEVVIDLIDIAEGQVELIDISDSQIGEERDIPTPNSIHLEINTYFRPIRREPKTPPKRLPDGSFEPEPTIVKTTPIKIKWPLPVNNVEMTDDDSQKENIADIDIDMLDSQQVEEEAQKSKSNNEVVENSPKLPKSKAPIRDSQVEDEDSQIPAIDIDRADSQKRLNWDEEFEYEIVPSAAPTAAVNPDPEFPKLIVATSVPLRGESSSSQAPNITAEDTFSVTSGASGSGCHWDRYGVWQVDEDELKWLTEEGNESTTSSQCSSVRMDLNEIHKQGEEFERLKGKWIQEAQDKRLAERLQKDKNEPRDEPYPLRNSATKTKTTPFVSSKGKGSSSSTATPTTSRKRSRRSEEE